VCDAGDSQINPGGWVIKPRPWLRKLHSGGSGTCRGRAHTAFPVKRPTGQIGQERENVSILYAKRWFSARVTAERSNTGHRVSDEFQ